MSTGSLAATDLDEREEGRPSAVEEPTAESAEATDVLQLYTGGRIGNSGVTPRGANPFVASPSNIYCYGVGAGVALGPVTGRLVAQLYCGEPPVVDPAPFAPDRFADR